MDTDTATCTDCGRTLTSPASITARRGPKCRAKVRAAARITDLRDFTPQQLDDAAELIADAGIVLLRGQVFQTVSTDGTEIYLTHPAACNCPRGLRRNPRPCYHMAAARIMVAAARRPVRSDYTQAA